MDFNDLDFNLEEIENRYNDESTGEIEDNETQ